ncbi:glycosyltransferase [Waterburya agarophytonicola K14]|uniref:Dolichol-phosphate mannosyltransferase n=1 Tax=Waterburya agarophytonicola KI4 TaxID=2874699 RepID=A0A964FFK9_9CYAN|nr:glycosyltransferase [Waterburya agarophytonicola]MCC0177102.1 glycosyltransferase [Waterburya agarophytonicola KI4]
MSQNVKLEDLIPVPTGILRINNLFLDRQINRKSIELSLIIPTYNESKNIEQLIQIIINTLDRIVVNQYELIVVDDNSPDFTWKFAAELSHKYSQVKVIRRESEKGLATATIRGWQAAKGQVLGVIDGDLQHPPHILTRLWQEIEKGADIAIASRNLEGGGVSEWSIARRFLSRGAQMLGLLVLPEVMGRISDPMSGYFMVRRDALLGKTFNPLGYKILVEVMARGNIRWIGEVGYIFQERKTGESKVTHQQYLEYLLHLIRLRLHLWQIDRFIRFGVSGFSGVFINLAVLYFLREFADLGLTRSAIIAAEIAIANNFFWNDRWTFKDISSNQKGIHNRLIRFLKFNLICLSGLILNILLLNILYNLLGINEYIANIIAIAIITFWNYWFNLKLSWRTTDTKK